MEETLDSVDDEEVEEEADAEVDKVLFELTDGKLGQAGKVGGELPVSVSVRLGTSQLILRVGREGGRAGGGGDAEDAAGDAGSLKRVGRRRGAECITCSVYTGALVVISITLKLIPANPLTIYLSAMDQTGPRSRSVHAMHASPHPPLYPSTHSSPSLFLPTDSHTPRDSRETGSTPCQGRKGSTRRMLLGTTRVANAQSALMPPASCACEDHS